MDLDHLHLSHTTNTFHCHTAQEQSMSHHRSCTYQFLSSVDKTNKDHSLPDCSTASHRKSRTSSHRPRFQDKKKHQHLSRGVAGRPVLEMLVLITIAIYCYNCRAFTTRYAANCCSRPSTNLLANSVTTSTGQIFK